MLTGAILLSRLSWSLSVPYPSFLALGGAVLTLVPGIPHIELDPGLALAIFVSPVLLDAAYDTSLRDLRDNGLPIATLVVVAVCVTTAGVALAFHALVPNVPWAAAIALGAIVAPPDAAAATAVLRQIKIPSRLPAILEGESLFNDASALLIFAVAVRMTQDGSESLAKLVPAYALSIVGSVLIGGTLGWLYPRVVSFIKYAPASILLQFCGTFGVWVLAEKLQLSPILTIVAYGIAIAQLTASQSDPLIRVKSYAVWDTVVFLTNVLAFSLIGLQLGPLWAKLSPDQRISYVLISVLVLLIVIAVRVGWVMTFNTLLRLKNRVYGVNLPQRMSTPTARGGVVIAWSGMRGIVSLAAALALPAGFPERDLIQFVAFAVVVGTLILQGFTLRPLVKLLNLPDDHQLEKEVNLAREAALKAAIGALDGDRSEFAQALRIEYQAVLDLGDRRETEGGHEMTQHEQLRARAVKASRETLDRLRSNGEIGDIAFRQIQEALDRADLYTTRYASDR